MRILIVGAGPAGLTLALALARSGIAATVVERTAGLNTGGYVVSLQANGWDVADRLGCLEELRSVALPADDSVYRHASGRELFRFRRSVLDEVTGGKMLHVPRDALVALLARSLAETGVDGPRFDREVVALASDPNGVEVSFSDGREERFDLVVGADGVHSQVRSLTFGSESGFVRPLGYRGAAWRMPFEGTLNPLYEGYMECGRQVILYQSGPKEISTLLCWCSEDRTPIAPDQRFATVSAAFAGTLPKIRQLIDGPVEWSCAYLDMLCQIEMPAWSRDRVVLLGDAAWCLSFLSGQGASMAMAGAWVLARELATGSPADALIGYEATLRAPIAAIQRNARAAAKSYVPRTAFSLALSRALLPVLMSRPLLKLRAKTLMAPSLIS